MKPILLLLVLSCALAHADNQQAKSSLALIQSGLTLAGVEQLFKNKTPTKISKSVASALRKELPPTHWVWTVAEIQWKKPWSKIFSERTGAIVQSFRTDLPLSKTKLKEAENLLTKTKSNTPERARLTWVLAHHYATKDNNKRAATLLKSLVTSKQNVIDRDLVTITVARIYYQLKDYDKAITHYDMISKSSDYWLESVEEKAWAHFIKGDFDKVQSDMKTLMSPIFVQQVGPEPYFLDGFAKLKTCDYAGIFKTISAFKTQFKERISVIDDLSKSGKSASASEALKLMASGNTQFQQIAQHAKFLPRLFYRDLELSRLAQRKGHFDRELAGTQNLNHKTLILIKSLERDAEKKTQQRMLQLAKVELDEARKIVNKFHILEAEVIHRMHLQDGKSEKEIQRQTLAGDEIEFPVSDDEVWLDEIDNYQVSSRGCPDQKVADQNQEKKL